MGGAASAVGNVVGGAAKAVGSAVSPVTSVANQIPVVGPFAGPVIGGITGGPLGAATSILGNAIQGNYGGGGGNSPSIGSSGLPQYIPGQPQPRYPGIPGLPPYGQQTVQQPIPTQQPVQQPGQPMGHPFFRDLKRQRLEDLSRQRFTNRQGIATLMGRR